MRPAQGWAYSRCMSRRSGGAFWFACGGIIGFSALAFHGIGLVTIVVALLVATVLVMLRTPGRWMALAGAGSVVAIGWALHITSGDTPDDQVWPVIVGVALGALGFAMFARTSGHPSSEHAV